MQIENSLFSLNREDNPPSAVALGYFDGVHIAHRAVINEAVACRSNGLLPTVLTFWGGKTSDNTILSKSQKLSEFQRLSVERVIIPPFSELEKINPKDFFERYIVGFCNAKAVFCGYDYRFGDGAKGDISLLKSLCDRYNIRLGITKQLTQSGCPISSTKIRALIKDGEVETANRLLGYDYYTVGMVLRGRQLGGQLGFPTINQELEKGLLVPQYGVYATTAWVDGIPRKSITNIGVAPTVLEGRTATPIAETHILDYNGYLYDTEIKVSYHRMLREEKKFSSLDELKIQIAKDVNSR